jgi:hypothetical protein
MATVVIMLWTLVTSFLILKAIDLTIGLRVSLEHELYGADYVEHMIPLPPEVKAYADDILLKVRAAEALKSSEKFKQIKNICKRSICCRISDILRGKSGDTESTKKEESNDVKSRGDSRIVEDNNDEEYDNEVFQD